jgi:methylase of polypeptide subunit release factors
MTVDGALAWARSLGVERLDAMVLLAHRLARTREWLLAHGDHPLDEAARAAFTDDSRRRADGVP